MGRYAKWIGGGLGWAYGGPIGAILGFVFGSIIDGISTAQITTGTTQAGDFAASLMILASAVIKADGKIMKSEINYIKIFLKQHFSISDANMKFQILKRVLEKDVDIAAVCYQITQNMDYAARLQLLHFLFGLANADGQVAAMEEQTINKISTLLGISVSDYTSIKSMFIAETGQYYKILEIDENASNEEVKKAYRKMAIKYHPDKVSHLGEKYQKAAQEKFQQLSNAYNAIKKERDFN